LLNYKLGHNFIPSDYFETTIVFSIAAVYEKSTLKLLGPPLFPVLKRLLNQVINIAVLLPLSMKILILCLTTQQRGRPDISHTLSVEKVERKNGPPNVRPEVNRDYRKSAAERIEQISSLLGNKQVRRAWERKDPKTAVNEIKRKIKHE
jgi:hypothetical protein